MRSPAFASPFKARFRPAVEPLEGRDVPSAVTVQADQLVRILDDNVFGVNVNSWDGVLSADHDNKTDTTPDPGTLGLVTGAGQRMLRLSNGSGTDVWHFDVRDDPRGWTSGAGLLANLTAAAAAEGMVCVNFGTGSPQEAAAYLAYLNGAADNATPLGADAGGKDWKTVGFWAGLRGQAPLAADDGYNHLRVGRAAPFGFKYFEVGNEAYFGAWQGYVMPSPAAYAQFAADFAALAGVVDPNARIGVGVGNPIEWDAQWNRTVLDGCRAAGFTPAFLSDHFYVFDGSTETPLSDADLLLHSVSDPASVMPIHANAPRNWAGRAAAYRALLQDRLGAAAAGVELLVGEFNSDADAATRQTTALTNGLFLADALGSLLQTEYNGAAFWNLRNEFTPVPARPGISGWRVGGDDAMLGSRNGGAPPQTGPYVPYPAYFAAQLASMLGVSGDSVVPVVTDTPGVAAYAVRRQDGRLALLLINKSPGADDAATVTVFGYVPASAARLWRYGPAEDDAQRLSADGSAALTFATPALAVAGGQFAVNLPAYSMTLLELAPANAEPPPAVPPTVPPVVPPTVPPALPPPPSVSPVLVGFPQFAVGSGDSPTAQLFNPDQSLRSTVSPFPGFAGSVRVAAADFNGDGVADLVVGTGPGGPTHVRVLDGTDGRELFAVDPFEPSFAGGVYVAAGDLTGDGVPDLVVTPDEGGGPRVRIFSGQGFGQFADFFGIDDPNFRGGARAAVGDIDGDGVGDLIVAAGFGGGPRVAAFGGASLASATPVKLFGDFLAFEPGLRNGVFVAAGDLDGDGRAELIAGGGPGGGPRVSAFAGGDLLANVQTRTADFFAGDSANRGGVRVAVKDLDGDDRADLVVGAGTGAGSRATAYAGGSIAAGGATELFGFDAFPGFAGGVFVG